MPKLVIVQGGQTGVDRGAFYGARDNGWDLFGHMPQDGRDELGAIPAEVAHHLIACGRPGLSVRTRVNLEVSGALLVVVPDKQRPYQTPGTQYTLRHARQLDLATLVVEPSDPVLRLAAWLTLLWDGGVWKNLPTFRLMVAGPRASKWADGELETAALLRRLQDALPPGGL